MLTSFPEGNLGPECCVCSALSTTDGPHGHTANVPMQSGAEAVSRAARRLATSGLGPCAREWGTWVCQTQ